MKVSAPKAGCAASSPAKSSSWARYTGAELFSINPLHGVSSPRSRLSSLRDLSAALRSGRPPAGRVEHGDDLHQL
jgi:hypothetical protein